MKRPLHFFVFVMVFLLSSALLQGTPANAFSAEDVELIPSLPSGQAVGTVITWTVTVIGSDPVDYRLSLAHESGLLRVMYDFSPKNEFEWAPIDDGTYTVVASVRNLTTDEIVQVASPYAIISRVTDQPIITPTANPLVALYSAPPCQAGNQMLVAFAPLGSNSYFIAPVKPCQPDHSMNFYIAGMRQIMIYWMRHVVFDATWTPVEYGPLQFHLTGRVEINVPGRWALDLPDDPTSYSMPVVLQSPLGLVMFATDILGRLIWYHDSPVPTQLFRPVKGGTFLLQYSDDNGLQQQILREIDLAGHTVRETTAPRISEQLVDMGKDPFLAVHHEGLRLPDGRTAFIGSTERILEDVQGPGPVDILSDYIVVLDEDWQVVWSWNGFDHLDITRKAILDETCVNGQGGCPPIFLDDIANDWLHSNAIAYSQRDGNLLLSMRHQDWIIKIDYRDGTGTGDVIWRLGPEGDFTIESDDPYPWFTHQHDPNYVGENQIVVYDNGNTRCEENPQLCYSRGQVYTIDDATMTASLALNADLGNYSFALGSAQPLPNGNFHFNSGIQEPGPDMFATSDEVRSDGGIEYSLWLGTGVYRSFRMVNLYTP